MTKVSLHRFVGLPQRFLVSLGLGLGLLTLGAIAPPPSPTQDAAKLSPKPVTPGYDVLPSTLDETGTFWEIANEANTAVDETNTVANKANTVTNEADTVTIEDAVDAVANEADTAANEANTVANEANPADVEKTLTVTVYTPTETCEGFQSQQQVIAADKAITQVVHFLLTGQSNNLVNFELSGYRIQTEDVGKSITVDFRRAPNAERHFVSLSMCEQSVLFGSLQKTLLENPALGVDTVRFTERGRSIQI